MTRVLIGVLFVVALLGAGVVGMVFGRFTQPADVPLAATTSSALDATSPTAILLVLPTVGVVSTAPQITTPQPRDQTTTAMYEEAFRATITPEAFCQPQIADLTNGQTADIVVTEDSFLWYTGEVFTPLFKGEIRGRTSTGMAPYALYPLYKDEYKKNPDTFSFKPGTYTIYYPPEMNSSNEVEILICPVTRMP